MRDTMRNSVPMQPAKSSVDPRRICSSTIFRLVGDFVRIKAAVDDASGLVEGRLVLEDRQTADGDDSFERRFVVARDAGQTAQLLRADTLLVAIAEVASASGVPPLYDAPPIPESPRARRQLLDEILLERP